MDAGRLLAVLQTLTEDYGHGYKAALAALIQAYTTARDTPSQDLTPRIDAALSELASALSEARSNTFPPSAVRIVAAIGGTGFVGDGALASITQTVSVAGKTPAGIVTALTTFSAQAAAFYKSCSQAEASLLELNIEPEVLGPGEFEVGIIIPESLSHSELGHLLKQLGAWNRALRGFAELSGEDGPEIEVRGLATGSLEAFLSVGAVTAIVVSRVIDKVLDWYQRIQEIQAKRRELAALGAPVAEAKQIEQFEKKFVEDSITSLAKELLSESKAKLSQERRGELQNQLTISIRHVVRFVDKGGDVEVSAGRQEVPDEPSPPPPEADADAQKAFKAAQKEFQRIDALDDEAVDISQRGSALRKLPPRPEPILQITEGDDDDEKPHGDHKVKAK